MMDVRKFAASNDVEECALIHELYLNASKQKKPRSKKAFYIWSNTHGIWL